MNKLYRGVRQNHIAKVFVDNAELSFDAAKKLHPSEATAEWSYFGDGPSQTSLAILYDAIQVDVPNAEIIALKYYHDFKFEFIAPADYYLGFTIFQSQVKDWLHAKLNLNRDDNNGWIV